MYVGITFTEGAAQVRLLLWTVFAAKWACINQWHLYRKTNTHVNWRTFTSISAAPYLSVCWSKSAFLSWFSILFANSRKSVLLLSERFGLNSWFDMTRWPSTVRGTETDGFYLKSKPFLVEQKQKPSKECSLHKNLLLWINEIFPSKALYKTSIFKKLSCL